MPRTIEPQAGDDCERTPAGTSPAAWRIRTGGVTRVTPGGARAAGALCH